MASTVKFYHYTDTRGKDAILASGFIRERPAGHRHAHFGPGTYGTSLPPSAGRQKIAINNWQSHWSSYVANGKLDWAIEVDIPAHKLRRSTGDRDILVHQGPIYLNNYRYQVVRGPSV